MKKITSVFLAFSIVFITTIQTSCIGSFNLTKAYWDWCNGIGNKWVNWLVYLVTAWLVQGIAIFIDALILNSIEFWSGSNPMAMAPGDMEEQLVVGKDGNTYKITATQNRFDFEQITGENAGDQSSLVFDPITKTWSHEKNCEVTKVMQFSEDGQFVSIMSQDGRVATVPADIQDKNLAARMIEEQMESQVCVN